jgi:hypothetical protein
MSIIISKNLKNAVRLDRKSFQLEDNLQQYIYDNPESIPLYDIKEDIRLLILAREFPTASGPIDAIGVDKEGEIYLVETKLYKNPDKRTVVAQVLDYGASLWKTYTNFEVFMSQLEAHVIKKFQKPLGEQVKEFYGISDDELGQFNERMQTNLNDGNFKFVVLMDQLHAQLKDLILFINQNSRFNIYGVELEYYKYESYEILIPKLYGAQVKKDILTPKPPVRIPTDDEFISAYQKIEHGEKMKEIIGLYNDIREQRVSIPGVQAIKTPKYVTFRFTFKEDQKQSFECDIHIDPTYESGGLQFWCQNKGREQVIKGSLKKNLTGITLRNNMTGAYGIIAKWPLEHFSSKELQNAFIALSK